MLIFSVWLFLINLLVSQIMWIKLLIQLFFYSGDYIEKFWVFLGGILQHIVKGHYFSILFLPFQGAKSYKKKLSSILEL